MEKVIKHEDPRIECVMESHKFFNKQWSTDGWNAYEKFYHLSGRYHGDPTKLHGIIAHGKTPEEAYSNFLIELDKREERKKT